MAEKLMYIPNDNAHNNSFCRLKLVVEAFKHSMNEPIKITKVTKVVKPTKKKTLF